jgi:predicted XRE-type DNA-binding protein
MDGQADMAPVSADEVARFLIDNPGADGADELPESAEPTDESPSPEDTDEPETDDDSPDDADEESDEEQPDPTSSRKFKVTVKGEDGADLEQEVDEKELIAGYQRHADYTRKTQDLASREAQAVEVVKAEVSKAQNHYIQQAQMAQAMVAKLAGLRSPEEMAQLAHVDPAGYVAEQARMQQVQHMVAGLQNQWQQEQFRQQQEQQAEMQKSFDRCWGVLGQKGIDKPKLQHIFETVAKDYGISQDRFATLNDPAVVMVMRDAVAYRELQSKRAEVTKKAEAAPRIPPKQAAPRADTQEKKRVERLRSGRGSRDDLAAFIANHNL